MTNIEKLEIYKKLANEYVNTKRHTKSIADIAKENKISKRGFSNYLKLNNIEIINLNRYPKVNQTIFDNIDTEEKAYWLGFLFADGCIHSKNRIEISLSAIDYEHLIKFSKFINHVDGENSVKKYYQNNYEYVRISFRSTIIANQLNNMGCTSKKSLTLKFPNLTIFENKGLIKDFLRGYFDGDGCLCIGKPRQRNKKHTVSFSCIGTEDFLLEFLKQLPLNKIYPIYPINKTSELTKVFNIWNSSALIATNFLYKNSKIYLQRKFDKYQEFCRLYEES